MSPSPTLGLMGAWSRATAALALCAVLASCGDGDAGREDAAPEAPATSSANPEPSDATPSTPPPVTTDEFCSLVRDIASGGGDQRGAATLELLRRGLPRDLEGDAKQGLQVLLDHAHDLGSVRGSWRVYRDLGGAERSDLRSLTWWVTKSCGSGYLKDLLPELPSLPDGLPGLG